MTDGAGDLVAAVKDQGPRLGLTWGLKTATVVGGNDPAAITLTVDGDTAVIPAVSMVGGMPDGTRVFVLQIPPSGLYIMGFVTADPGFRYLTSVYFTVSGTFTTKDYPGLRAVRVRAQAGGNAGGGAALTVAAQTSAGSGGRGGGYAESFLLAADISTSQSVTVGAGGTGVSGAAGNEGGDSSFGSLVVADHGDANSPGGTLAASSTTAAGTNGGAGAQASTGDLSVRGSGGAAGWRSGVGTGAIGGGGGGSHLGGGGPAVGVNTGSLAGTTGLSFGGGGGGAANGPSNAAVAGGSGVVGIVIVDVYI